MNNLRVNEIALPINDKILDEIVVPHIRNCPSCLQINDSVLLLQDEQKKLEMAKEVCVHSVLEVLTDWIGRAKDHAKAERRRKK